VFGGRAVHVAPRGAAADGDGAGLRIDDDIGHAREVDYHPVIDDPETPAVVAAAAYGDRHAVVSRKGDRLRDVVRAPAADDERRMAIDHPVVNGSGLVVARIPRADEMAAEVSELAPREIAQ
jgi:hypothetical protein